MAQNRYLPYGYKIENGKTEIQPQEAEIIRKIYRQYADGLSYLKIAEELTKSGIRYMPNKPIWNKNMVARILQNKNYLGTEKYPLIVEESLAKSAQWRTRPYTHTESAEIKVIKPLLQCGICGESLRRRLKADGSERWHCPSNTEHVSISVTDQSILQEVNKLSALISDQALERPEKKSPSPTVSVESMRLENEIDRLLEQTVLNVKGIQEKIAELAAERYRLCEDIQHIQGNQLSGNSTEYYIGSLAKQTASVQISHNKVTALVLKNGTMIKEGDARNE